MRSATDFADRRREGRPTSQVVWIVLIMTSGVCFSAIFACVTPFAALGTLAALKLCRRDAVAVVTLVWLANQAIGYGYLGYPWTWDSAAWGLAIGISAGLAIVAAAGLSTTRSSVPMTISLPFVAGFAAFEAGLYVAGFVLPGSEGAFTSSVLGRVFLINAVTLCGLVALSHLTMLCLAALTRHTAQHARWRVLPID